MRVYVLPSSFRGTGSIVLSGKDAHYLIKVLRMKAGYSFAGRDSNGEFWDLAVTSIGKGSCTLSCSRSAGEPKEVSDTLPSFRGPFPEIHLYQGICKGKKMEQIVRQVTELGVTRIIPVASRHGVVDLSGKEEDRKQRLEIIAKEALQQSGSPVMTAISMPIDVNGIPTDWGNRGTAIVLHQLPIEGQRSLQDLVREHLSLHPQDPVALVIGPEGGFSDQEVGLLTDGGFQPVLLKTNILRTETAAIVAAGVVQQMLVDHL